METAIFFPTTAEFRKVREAKTTCAGCPVRKACGEEALALGEQHGIWGGMTSEQRTAIRRRRRQGNVA